MEEKTNEQIIEMMKAHWRKLGVEATDEMMGMIKQGWESVGMNPLQVLTDMMKAQDLVNQYSNTAAQAEERPYRKFQLADEQDTNQPEVLQAIAAGSNLSILNRHPLNSLSTFTSPFMVSRMMSNDWGINSKEELLETLIWLQMQGHRKYYHLILDQLQDIPPSQWTTVILKDVLFDSAYWLDSPRETDHKEELSKVNTYLENVMAGYIRLSAQGCFKTMELPRMETWDFGRAINLIRWGYDASYLSLDEASHLLGQCLDELKETYHSWESLSEGYLMGFMMWSGNDRGLMDMHADHLQLLEHPESPWVILEW